MFFKMFFKVNRRREGEKEEGKERAGETRERENFSSSLLSCYSPFSSPRTTEQRSSPAVPFLDMCLTEDEREDETHSHTATKLGPFSDTKQTRGKLF